MPYLKHKFIRPNTLAPRLYQETIAANAKNANLLCVLPTGLGKTIVAILVAAHRLSDIPGSKILVMAPTKPLVNQLRNEFAKYLNFNESEFQILIGTIPPKKRKEIWKTAKFIFATPQTVESDIVRRYVNLEEFSLAIFDECVSGDTEILLANGTYSKIKDVVDDFTKGKEVFVLSFDKNTNKFVHKKITNAYALPCFKRLLEIRIGDKTIKATEDHPFLVKRKDTFEWVKASNLTLGENIAEFPHSVGAYLLKDTNALVTDEDIIKTYSDRFQEHVKIYKNCQELRRKFNWGGRRISKKLGCSERQVNNWIYFNRAPKPLKLTKSLRQRGLLPLSYNSPNIQIISRIFGHIYGDGWVSEYGKSKYVIGFSGKTEDLEEIQADLRLLGLKYSSIHSRKTKSIVEGNEIQGTTNSFVCSDHHLARLVIALGVPRGRFSTQEILVPEWIMNAPREIKREFLAALFGSDAHHPAHRKDSRSFYAIRFSLNKIEDLKENGVQFAEQIKSMLLDLDVKTSQIKVIPGNVWKNGVKSVKIILTISNSTENLINFFQNISYRYCARKELKSAIALNYLLDKSKIKNDMHRLYKAALAMKSEGHDNQTVVKRLGIPLATTENWVYSKYKGGNMSPLSFDTVDSWISKNCSAPLLWKKVSGLSIAKNELVYDITVEDTHNFIANGFIVHNCHRATGNYSYTWISKILREKNKDANILALTASPASDKSSLQQLCATMGIEKVEVRSPSDIDVAPYVKRKEIEKVDIILPPELHEIIKALENVLKKRLLSLKDKGLIPTADLSRVRKTMLLDLQRTIGNQIGKDQDSYLYLSLIAECLKIQHALLLLQTQGVSPLIDFFKKMEKQARTVKAARRLVNDWSFKRAMILAYEYWGKHGEHPKFGVLKNLVEKHRGEKMIIFTQYRSTVEKIVAMLSDLDGIKPARFIGQAKGMNQKEQVARINAFRDGKYNVLVSSSIGEEGLDIPSVPVGIFFEPVPSALRMIQRRGRAGRTEIAKIYVLVAKGTIDESYFHVARHRERRMNEILENMKEEVSSQSSLDNWGDA